MMRNKTKEMRNLRVTLNSDRTGKFDLRTWPTTARCSSTNSPRIFNCVYVVIRVRV